MARRSALRVSPPFCAIRFRASISPERPAGFADASVRSCWAKCVLSGGNYVGGVAGWASRLRDSCAIVTIEEGTEYLGAVAGGVDADGVPGTGGSSIRDRSSP